MRYYGLQLAPRNKMNFQLGAVEGLPLLEDLPERFQIDVRIRDQKQSDFCTAMVASLMSEAQEKVDLSPEWWFALSKRLSGGVDNWGQTIHFALKVGLVYGAIEKAWTDWSLENKDTSFLRDPDNWPDELIDIARKHLKDAYFEVSGRYDHFDNARAAIWKYREEMRVLGMGVLWGWPMSNKVIRTIPQNGEGHMIGVSGWDVIDDETFIVLPNSYGVGVGDKGKFYMDRKTFNHFADRYGVFMYKDMPEGVTKEKVIEQSRKYRANWFEYLALVISYFFRNVWQKLTI